MEQIKIFVLLIEEKSNGKKTKKRKKNRIDVMDGTDSSSKMRKRENRLWEKLYFSFFVSVGQNKTKTIKKSYKFGEICL